MALSFGRFRSAFNSPDDRYSGLGIRPVIFDILGPDQKTSLLGNLKMVLHINPTTMKINYQKIIERIQTKGGFVEQHFGEGVQNISFEFATGGFMRLYSGLSNITGDGLDLGGNRRETLAYDKYQDLLALFLNNGMIRDSRGTPVFDGILRCSFDEISYLGRFENASVSEEAEKPYQFTLSAQFVVSQEEMILKSRI